MTIRVFVVDDHPLFRAGVRLATQDVEDIEVVGEADSAEEAVRAVVHERIGVDVVLMDVQMPGVSGVSAAAAIVAAPPPGAEAPRVLMMSVSDDDDLVVAALRAGAHGYLVKGAPRAELLGALRTVAQRSAVFGPTVAARMSGYFSAVHETSGRAAFPQLTEREREILSLIARGYPNRRIARELVLAEKTVRNHVSHVFAKLQVEDRASAVVRARDAGLGV
ncbi:response regulator transcription factor [Streptomyces sp. Z26]|uniref:response regulator n=1 Tax=Streptomyces TaxID=1883 RepID=UPI000EF14AD9|nr:response regulator transcription factor [Streptomyces sp. Z26]RLL69802.1 DNA-binding response regulator [Streptomyces sp. Z26]